MSLVGTRPILQDELLKYELHHRARIAIKPGITGMWQVSGRSDITDFEEVVRLDTEYISNWNFGLDEKIKSLMKLYAKTYQIIGIVIAGLGICLVPFIGHIVGDVSYIKENIILLYLLFLLNSVISYFFVYKKSLIIACQKNYIVDIYQQIFYAFQVVAQILFLAITKQFIMRCFTSVAGFMDLLQRVFAVF